MGCGDEFGIHYEGEKGDSHVFGYLGIRFRGGQIDSWDSMSLVLAILNLRCL